jgi:DNA (cytosine-5)-methyltransferase 1
MNLFNLPYYTTVGEVLTGLGEPMPKVQGTTFQNCEDSHVDVTPARDRERISYVPEGSYLAAQTHVGVEIRGNLMPKDTTKYLRAPRKTSANVI